MRLKVGIGNPYGTSRYGFLWQILTNSGGTSRHLDFGTFDGGVPATLVATGVAKEAVGVDAVDNPPRELPQGVTFERIQRGSRLPFPDGDFTSASALDVIEHIADQSVVLKELRRVLAPGGLLVVTVPRRHVFSPLDLGNLKFRFPRAHRWHYVRHHGQASYEVRYADPDSGFIGDIESDKRWHEHFTEGRMESLLVDAGFDVDLTDGTGFLMRPLVALATIHPRVSGWLTRPRLLDDRLFELANLFVAARAI